MKKIICSALFFAMLLTSLTGCGYVTRSKAATACLVAHNGAIPEAVADIDCQGGYVSSGNSSGVSNYPVSYGIEEYGSEDFNTEEYNIIEENSFTEVSLSPLSTFAADVDTGSYCNLRRMVNGGWMLDNIASSVRTEEIVNYFDYTVDSTDNVFSVQYSVGDCPWNEDNKLLVMTMQANSEVNVPNEGNNFVFLIDSSGSMEGADRLDMAIDGFKLLASRLGPQDRVSIVTYSGSSDTILEGSNDYDEICDALDEITASGGTNGSGGIEAAYECASDNFIENGNNRVILASDGDMNLGVTSQSGLVDLIKEKKETGIFLTTLGFGSGNYSDANMESIADAGNGNYFYIDSIDEAERVLCEKMMQSMVTVAKDVKFQVEFNPAEVYAYRQIGYENRQMAASDFTDDTKDGGEIGAGAQVTVCYELVPMSSVTGDEDGLRYQDSVLSEEASSGELCTVSVRYKEPDSDESTEIEYPLVDCGITNEEDFNFICGIIETSMLMRDSEYAGSATFDTAYELAMSGAGGNRYREEFCDMILKIEDSID